MQQEAQSYQAAAQSVAAGYGDPFEKSAAAERREEKARARTKTQEVKDDDDDKSKLLHGRYHIHDGNDVAGGLHVVKMGRDRKTKKDVALKFIPAADKFEVECEILQELPKVLHACLAFAGWCA